MGVKSYFCQKCKQKHRYTSKIGTQHLNYRTRASIQVSTSNSQLKAQPIKKDTIRNKKKAPIKSNVFSDYQTSYSKGVQKFGIWWTIFQLSVWSLAAIFLIMAAIIFVIYLPKIEMIHW
jgi:hypothetical protein